MARILLLIAALPSALAPGVWRSSADLEGTTTAAGKPVADAVIWLDAREAPRPPDPTEIVLDQRNMAFSPRVLAVQAGTTIRFPNSDRVFHNVFSFHDGKKFDLGLYPVGAVRNVAFNRPGLSRIFCNIHPQMAAYVMVVDTPFFAVSDLAGRFTIRAVPLDTYAYTAWRPAAPMVNGTVVVRRGQPLQVRWP